MCTYYPGIKLITMSGLEIRREKTVFMSLCPPHNYETSHIPSRYIILLSQKDFGYSSWWINNIKELSFVSRCRRLIWIAMFRRLISTSLLQAMRSTYSASPYEARCSTLIGWFSTAVTGASLYFILSFKLDVVDSRFELSKHEPISFFCPQLLWKLWQYPLGPLQAWLSLFG